MKKSIDVVYPDQKDDAPDLRSFCARLTQLFHDKCYHTRMGTEHNEYCLSGAKLISLVSARSDHSPALEDDPFESCVLAGKLDGPGYLVRTQQGHPGVILVLRGRSSNNVFVGVGFSNSGFSKMEARVHAKIF